MKFINLLILSTFSVFVFWRNNKPVNADMHSMDQVVLDSSVIGVSTVISGLDVPWEITWGSDNHIWMTEQGGTVSRVNPKTGQRKVLLQLKDVYRHRSMGLLGMAVSKDLKNQPYVFLDYTCMKEKKVLTNLVRYTYRKDTLLEPLVLLKDVPGGNGHNGARIVIAPDGKLMISTGDATVGSNAQDKGSVNGKILRLNMDGSVPKDNPIAGSSVWSWGHRNIQGLAFDSQGLLYSSEHGDAIEDELNIIRKGSNYGWPKVEGMCSTDEEKEFCKTNRVTEPIRSWTPTIAPAGIAFYPNNAIPEWKNSVLLTSLKASSLYVLQTARDGRSIASEKLYFSQVYGRLRDVCVSPSGDVYISTSNKDWNPSEGFPRVTDDRILRLTKIKTVKNTGPAIVTAGSKSGQSVDNGKTVYANYCASCHKNNGEGITGNFPPLKGNNHVTGDETALITTVLNGMSGPLMVNGVEYNQAMPAFRFLSDKDVAEVVTYIRKNFGNRAGEVTIKDVEKARNGNTKP